ncbi:dnaJ homolog subfamily B member 9-like [Chironomus tepperi]|uniref:dnaJ homolog subfamily B member 9-like n=1 Tax=Chironomus tepperi TaxID=113505 RepID=UPI00391F3891
MYRLTSESKILTNLISRNFVTKSKNLYDVLGITPNATQADIKAAYYKLSKAYHPDTAKDKSSGDNFRAITEAYEVLGNYRLKKLYDKGIIHTAGKDYAHHSRASERTQPYDESDHDDDPTTKFYKSRLRQQHAGRSKVYDFDEWTQSHYGATFKKQQETKRRQDFKYGRDSRHSEKTGSRNALFGLLAVIVCFVVIAEYVSHTHLDVVDPALVKSKKSSDN